MEKAHMAAHATRRSNISRMAGSRHGVRLEPEQLVEAARAAGRTPAQRTTLYEIVETY